MTQRTTRLLASCEYVSKYPSNNSQTSGARRELIEAVNRVCPDFLTALSDRVFPLYAKLAKAGYDFDRILWSPQVSPYELIRTSQFWHIANKPPLPRKMDRKRARAKEKAEAEVRTAIETNDFTAYRNAKNRIDLKVRNGWSRVSRNEDLESLTVALRKWTTKFNVDDEWLVNDALRTLRGWFVAPEWRRSLRWDTQYGLSRITASTGERFEFTCEGWETELLTWSRYSESVRERFAKQLSQYERETRKLAESHGLVRARRKYSPNNFDWFVLYQFAGQSSTEIAKTGYGDDPDSTVLKGIKAVAKLIGWQHIRKVAKAKRRRKIQ